uniref:SHSP domain-containing protein n=1 Tax=Lotharella globosa TaxID=91324 RepID=A0A7S3YEG7_9EUKA
MNYVHLHDSSSSKRRTCIRRPSKLTWAAIATVMIEIIGVGCYVGVSLSENRQRLGAPQVRQSTTKPAISQAAVSSKPTTMTSPRPTKTSAWMYDPFSFGSRGIRQSMNDMFEVFDWMDRMNDMDEYLLARRRLRQNYWDEMLQRDDSTAPQSDGKSTSGMIEKSEPAGFPFNKNIDIANPMGLSTLGRGWAAPSLQLSETDKEYRYTMDIQGMDKADLKLSLQNNIMIVQGTKMEKTEDGFHTSSFKRSFTMPPDANLDSLSSKELENGHLLISAEKVAPSAGDVYYDVLNCCVIMN